MKGKLKENQGITLVALVITIVVLLILATVAIVSLSGENNIISKAQKAKDDYAISSTNEESKLGEYANKIESYAGTIKTSGNVEYYMEEHVSDGEGLVNVTVQQGYVIDYDNNKLGYFEGDDRGKGGEFDLHFSGWADITIVKEDITINIGDADEDRIDQILTVSNVDVIYPNGGEAFAYIKDGRLYVGCEGKAGDGTIYYDLDDYYSLTSSSISSRFVYQTEGENEDEEP